MYPEPYHIIKDSISDPAILLSALTPSLLYAARYSYIMGLIKRICFVLQNRFNRQKASATYFE